MLCYPLLVLNMSLSTFVSFLDKNEFNFVAIVKYANYFGTSVPFFIVN